MKEIAYLKLLEDYETERLRIRIRTNNGKVIDIVVQYETLLNNKWTPIVRYDCAHGFFHRDVLFPKGEKEKETIAISSSLKDALSYAEQEIKDRWEFYKERYIKRMKR